MTYVTMNGPVKAPPANAPAKHTSLELEKGLVPNSAAPDSYELHLQYPVWPMKYCWSSRLDGHITDTVGEALAVRVTDPDAMMTAFTVNVLTQPVCEVAATPLREPPGKLVLPVQAPITHATVKVPRGATLPEKAPALQGLLVSANGFVPISTLPPPNAMHVHRPVWPTKPRYAVISDGHRPFAVLVELGVRVGDTASADTALTVKPPAGLLMAEEVMPLELPPG